MDSQHIHLKKGDFLLDRYKILAYLGAGGMSTVYLVEDLSEEGKWYAVKESRMDPRWYNRLMIEAKVLGELDHPRLPRIRKLFLSGDRKYFYIVLEFVEGTNLAKLLKEKHLHLPYDEVIDYATQICELLQFLHDRNIVYKDLKPSNVMVDKRNNAKLIDFGLARKYGNGESGDQVRMGTVGFAAPELFQGSRTDARTDLFSLGAMLYFLLSGGKYVQERNKPVRKMLRKFPGKLTKCIEELVREDPKNRIQSAREVEVILKQVRDRKSLFGLPK